MVGRRYKKQISIFGLFILRQTRRQIEDSLQNKYENVFLVKSHEKLREDTNLQFVSANSYKVE